MKIKLILILLTLTFVALAPTFTQAQDLSEKDTLIILTSRPTVSSDSDPKNTDSTFVVEVWIWNDNRDVSPALGFKWNSDKLTLDSAIASAEAAALYIQVFFYDSNIGLSNDSSRALFGGLNFSGTGLTAKANRYLVATYYFTISPKWEVADEIIIDTSEWDDSSELFFLNPQSGDTWVPVYFAAEAIRILDPSDADDPNSLPDVYSLGQNYPNPFNPETTIEFSLAKADNYTFTVYNVIGQVVFQKSDLGQGGINIINFDGSSQASGVYFYKLTAGDYSETKKMMLVK